MKTIRGCLYSIQFFPTSVSANEMNKSEIFLLASKGTPSEVRGLAALCDISTDEKLVRYLSQVQAAQDKIEVLLKYLTSLSPTKQLPIWQVLSPQ